MVQNKLPYMQKDVFRLLEISRIYAGACAESAFTKSSLQKDRSLASILLIASYNNARTYRLLLCNQSTLASFTPSKPIVNSRQYVHCIA